MKTMTWYVTRWHFNDMTSNDSYTILSLIMRLFTNTHKEHLTLECKHDIYNISNLRTQAVISHKCHRNSTITLIVHKKVFFC